MAGQGKPSHTSADSNGIVKLRQRNAKKERRMMLETFLVAMKEDLSEWLSSLMKAGIDSKGFMSAVENGVVLCQGANIIQAAAEKYARKHPASKLQIPTKGVHVTTKGATSGSFVARDNVANFIAWCRALGILEAIMFESEDLVLHKNEKSVILTLLDVARKANKFGVKPPEIVVLEEEIDRELELDRKRELAGQVERTLVLEKDNNLDDLVKEVVDQCSCHSRFPVKKLADGKYKVGKQKTLIFVRVMRNHVMVRVGGGWDTLTHYFEKHDPCRLHVAGELDERGKCGQKFSPEESPLRQRKKLSADHNWDGDSVCSTESSGSGETHSSFGSMGDTLCDRGHLRGGEAPRPHGSHTASQSPRSRISTMPSSRSGKPSERHNGHTSSTHHWVQNHTDGNGDIPASPRLRSKTCATRSPLTTRRNNMHPPASPIQQRRGSKNPVSPRQNQQEQTPPREQQQLQPPPSSNSIDRRRFSGIPVPIKTLNDPNRPSYLKSRTLDVCGASDAAHRRRTSTMGGNSNKTGAAHLNMVGRRERSMDSMLVSRMARTTPRRRADAVNGDSSQLRASALRAATKVSPRSPSCRRKLEASDRTRDCRMKGPSHAVAQPRATIFTV